MGKAGQTALALAVCVFVWFGFFFQCWKSNSEPSGYAHEPHLQLLGLACLNDSSMLWVLETAPVLSGVGPELEVLCDIFWDTQASVYSSQRGTDHRP